MIHIKWTFEKLQEESLKYKTRTEFYRGSKWAYGIAHKMGIFEEICLHMPKPGLLSARIKWTFEMIEKEATKYNSREEFKTKSKSAYAAAVRNGILDQVCKHMKYKCYPWTEKEVRKEALKYSNRLEFQNKSKGAYNHAWSRGILDDICSHMKRPKWKLRNIKWTNGILSQEALKYDSRVDFLTYSPSAYSICSKRGILNDVCSHMKRNATTSVFERELMSIIKDQFSSTKTLKIRKINIKNRPYIKGFDIDIYIPELRKGIEFDGTYYHSFEGLKRTRSHWPDEAIKNYHQTKDAFFFSKGIRILHIKESDWIDDKEDCINRCLSFLSV